MYLTYRYGSEILPLSKKFVKIFKDNETNGVYKISEEQKKLIKNAIKIYFDV